MTLPVKHWKPSPNFSARSGVPLDLIVIHDCQGGYDSAISWFENPQSQVSAHFVLNENGTEVTQMVALSKKAWHCKAYNSRSIGIEMAGFEAQGFGAAEWRLAARLAAYCCHLKNIPPRWAREGRGSGIARHLDLGAAGGGHVDPTQDVGIWNNFIRSVENEWHIGGFPTDYAII